MRNSENDRRITETNLGLQLEEFVRKQPPQSIEGSSRKALFDKFFTLSDQQRRIATFWAFENTQKQVAKKTDKSSGKYVNTIIQIIYRKFKINSKQKLREILDRIGIKPPPERPTGTGLPEAKQEGSPEEPAK